MTQHDAKQSTYENEPAIFLKYGKYSAIVLPGVGGNLISFRDEERGYAFIREPESADWEAFLERPWVHGVPVLFPPNRYDRGTFEFDGRTYRFPVNEPSTGNHLHGFVYSSKWDVVEFGSTEEKSFVTVRLRFDEKEPGFAYFPHKVTLSQTFTLTDEGLSQRFDAVNESDVAIPFMLGFHTTVNAPFAPGSRVEDLQCGISFGESWELDGRMLPTGKRLPLNEGERLLRDGKGNPYFVSLDNHYTASPVDGVNAMTLYDSRVGVKFVYEAGDGYKHWMVYNAQAGGEFFCPEPQTGMVNAPNVDLPAEETGLIRLEPGQSWTATSRMYAE
ncbi:aldose 1-epimerase [Cohnella terricola]|uniref:Aldose 1-epimerase n=1 Tax=Cohnella terricola TaxID=1289167 RepID=A0A559JKJ1_9BACL|nr:aldose 1-epimerase [Cohnella terricola]TVY00397.1 aldose 1-epimerase [Cohnella terricola]